MTSPLNPNLKSPALINDPPTQDNEYCEEYIVNNKKNFRCTFPDCGKIFKFKSEIIRHLPVHAEKKSIVCPYEGCNKTFKRTDALRTHIRVHTNQLPFECDFAGCGLKFATQAGLRYHLLKHSDQKVYKCSFEGCEKTFLTLSQLKQHEKTINYHQKLGEGNKSVLEEFKQASPQIIPEIREAVSLAPQRIVQEVPVMERRQVEIERKREKSEDSAPKGQSFDDMVQFLIQESRERKNKIALCKQFFDTFQENHELKMNLNRQGITNSLNQMNSTMAFHPRGDM